MPIGNAGRHATATRKTSRQRSNWTGDYGHVPKFEAIPEHWTRLEEVSGAKFEDINKLEIKSIVDRFLESSAAAKSAPLAADVQAELDAIRASAKSLKSVLTRPRTTANSEAQNRLESRFKQWRPHEPEIIDKLGSILSDVIISCGHQIEESKAGAGAFDEIKYWEAMIVRLTAHFRDFGLPVGAKFTDFVSELQKIIPEESTKRSTQSIEALDQTIKRARRADRERKKEALRADRSHGTKPADAAAENVPFGQE